MPIHPALRTRIEERHAASLPPHHEVPIGELRAIRQSLLPDSVRGKPIDLPRVEELTLVTPQHVELKARLYSPQSTDLLPIIVYYHGGGWVMGDLDLYDQLCRRIAHKCNSIVVSVDYRLAPEHPFPAPLDDAYGALTWIYDHALQLGGDPNNLFVAGDSAGGNLAAVCALMARDLKGPEIGLQILIYPVIDLSCSFPSIDMDPNDVVIGRADLEWSYDTYYGIEKNLKSPLVSPFWANDLSKLPPALIITAEYDSLRDEAEAYAEKLRGFGNKARCIRYNSMTHDFVQLAGLIDEADLAVDDIARAVEEQVLFAGVHP